MSARALHLGLATRRRSMRGLGDDANFGVTVSPDTTAGGGGWGIDMPTDVPVIDIPLPSEIPTIPMPGTISIQDLQQQWQSGQIDTLPPTPYPYYGQPTGQFNDPYGNPSVYAYGPNGAPFSMYLPNNMSVGGGGGAAMLSRTGVPISAATSGALASSSTALASASSLFSRPVIAGSSITWGWVLVGGLVLWLLSR